MNAWNLIIISNKPIIYDIIMLKELIINIRY